MCLFSKIDWKSKDESTGVPSLSKQTINKVDVIIPQNHEQEVIGTFFQKIDNLITLHQRKHFIVKCVFCNGKKDRIWANAWEQRKAETLFISYAEKGYPELPVLSATQDKGMVYRDDTGKNIFHDKNNEIGYKRVQPGQFVIHLRSFQGGFAHSAILGITSPAYTIFGFKEGEKQYDLYWKYVFSSPEFIRRLETVTYGIRDGRSISYDEFLTMKFVVPEYKEQVVIADNLIKIDNLITLHQCKCDTENAQSTIVFQNVFVKKMANAWEQRKLSDCMDLDCGQDYKHLSKGNIPVYGTGGYMLSVDRALSYDKDGIGIGRKGTIDKPYLLKAPFWTVDTLFFAIPKKK